VVSAVAQIYIDTHRHGKHKVILGPAGCVFRTWLAGKKKITFGAHWWISNSYDNRNCKAL